MTWPPYAQFSFGRALILASLVAIFPSPSHGQAANQSPSDPNTVGDLGMEGFRYLLNRRGLEPLLNTDEAQVDPAKTIIILLGPESIQKYFNSKLDVAVMHGASLLIASDRSADNTHRVFGVDILDEFVHADPVDCFHGLIRFPFVRPLKGIGGGDAASPLTIFQEFEATGENAIATMNASVLNLSRPPRHFRPEKLAGYPLSAQLPGGHCVPERDFFAIGGQYGDGRVLILADHSVFVNVMLLRTGADNANWSFTDNCIGWLQGDEQKTRCLFVEDGVVKTEFQLPGASINWLELMVKAALVAEKHGDQLIAEKEEQDFFNQLILSRFNRREIVRFALMLFTFGLLAVGLWWFGRSRVGPDPARTLITPELAFLIPHGNVLQQRMEQHLESDNVYEFARQVLREFFTGLEAEPDAQGRPPRVVVEKNHDDEARLRARIARLWHLAYGASPVRITTADWQTTTEDLKVILEEADNGWWKFVPARTT